LIFYGTRTRVVDPDSLNKDPDPAFFLNPNPDPVPVPDPSLNRTFEENFFLKFF
jgi:hypothetical protein